MNINERSHEEIDKMNKILSARRAIEQKEQQDFLDSQKGNMLIWVVHALIGKKKVQSVTYWITTYTAEDALHHAQAFDKLKHQYPSAHLAGIALPNSHNGAAIAHLRTEG